MSKKTNPTVINYPKIEQVLQRLHQEANKQTPPATLEEKFRIAEFRN